MCGVGREEEDDEASEAISDYALRTKGAVLSLRQPPDTGVLEHVEPPTASIRARTRSSACTPLPAQQQQQQHFQEPPLGALGFDRT